MIGRLKDIWRVPYPAYITSWKTVAVSAGVSSVFAWALPRVFPRWYAERGWTLGKEVVNTLALLLSIAVCVWLYVAWLTGMTLSFRLFFIVLLWVLILGAFPTVLFALWNRNIQLARNLCEARKRAIMSACIISLHTTRNKLPNSCASR